MQVLGASINSSIHEAVNIIRAGGIVSHATETCYGLACDFTNESAVRKVFELKKRPEGMPISALFPSVESAKEWVEWNEVADRLADEYLPGPLTIVLPVRNVPHASCLVSRTLGIRISPHPVAQKLAELAEVPLSTTSANIHGGLNPYSVDDVISQFFVGAQHAVPGSQPELILDSGKLPHADPSTVVAIENGKIKILRQGSIMIEL